MEKIKWCLNTMPKSDKEKSIEILTEEEVKKARNFHESFPQYKETPLVSLENLSKYLGVAGIYIKDESYRFDLNAFKVLGGSYAMARYLAERLGKDISELPQAEIDRLKHYFLTYKNLPGEPVACRIDEVYNSTHAKEVITASQQDYTDKYER